MIICLVVCAAFAYCLYATQIFPRLMVVKLAIVCQLISHVNCSS